MDVSQYLEIFIDETNGHLQTLSDNIMQLEKEPENKDVINEIFRAAHSLKGMAGTMGFKRMQRLTHDMENVFQEIRSDKMKVTSSLIDVLFDCLDAIDGYLENVKETSDEGTNDNEAIVKELNDILAGGAEESEAAPAAEPEAPAQETKAVTNYMDFELNNKEKDDIKEAQDAGHKVYAITVKIQKECLLKAARAFLVFKAVEDFGQIIVYRPSSQDIEDEKFEDEFSFFLDSEETDFEKIKAAANAVSEIEERKFLLQHLKAVQKKKKQRSLKRQKHRQRHIRHRQKQHRHLQAQKRRQQARANPHRNRLQTVRSV